MTPIDWRELYAENRAVIERHRRGPHDRRRLLPPQPQRDMASGGTWEPLDHRDATQARRSFVYTPQGIAPGTAVPLVVMLHGCTQKPGGFAAATAMNRAADRHGFVVLYPEQARDANQQGCWNWFLPAHQHRDRGEPAFIAGAARAVMDASRWSIEAGRVFVAGLSAGGAMAAVVAATHPDLFSAVAVHSGLAYGCATDVGSAFAAMANGGRDARQQPQAVLDAMGRHARPMPTIVVHGMGDRVVAPVNGEQLVAQWLTANRLASSEPFEADPRRPTSTEAGRADGGLAFTRRRWTDRRGGPLVEHLSVHGLAHAWSGGTANGSFTDPNGPSATDAIWDFFREVDRDGD
jgi:poly(hydroxyalkanoate) depolymerase family esterase